MRLGKPDLNFYENFSYEGFLPRDSTYLPPNIGLPGF